MTAISAKKPHSIPENLKQAGIILPSPPASIASYVGYVVSENMIYISGQLPMRDGKPAYTGKVGKDIDLAQAQDAAKICAINILAQLNAAIGGDWQRVLRCVKVNGFVNCIDGYADQPKVINGASDFLYQIMGEAGRHARAALGVNALPLGVPVEIEAVFLLG